MALFPEDRERLKRQRELLDPETSLYPLDVHELRLVTSISNQQKTNILEMYVDRPVLTKQEPYYSPMEKDDFNTPMDSSISYLNSVAAVEYQSWYVTKVSRKNKLSKRILSIDQLAVTNSHVPGNLFRSMKPILHKTFPMERIIKAQLVEGEPEKFIIQVQEDDFDDEESIYEGMLFKEWNETIAKYIARTIAEASQIVSKIMYFVVHNEKQVY